LEHNIGILPPNPWGKEIQLKVLRASSLRIENILKSAITIAFLENRWVSEPRRIILIPNNLAPQRFP
jgi:hypothetical protein